MQQLPEICSSAVLDIPSCCKFIPLLNARLSLHPLKKEAMPLGYGVTVLDLTFCDVVLELILHVDFSLPSIF